MQNLNLQSPEKNNMYVYMVNKSPKKKSPTTKRVKSPKKRGASGNRKSGGKRTCTPKQLAALAGGRAVLAAKRAARTSMRGGNPTPMPFEFYNPGATRTTGPMRGGGTVGAPFHLKHFGGPLQAPYYPY